MHELSIAQQIINLVEQYLPNEKQISVKAVKLKIGKLNNIFIDSLKFCYETLSKDTKLENSVLNIEFVPAIIECKDCSMVNEITDEILYCHHCNSFNIQIKSGYELEIKELEIN